MCANALRGRDRWAPVGRFRYFLRDDRWEWSAEVARMHGYEPGSVTPTTSLILAHKHPDEKPIVAELVGQVRRHGVAFSNRHRIIDTRGDPHMVVVVGDRLYDNAGRPAGTAGFYVDITEPFQADVRKRLTESVTAVNERRAVINQAMGIMMLRFGVDANSAFQLMTKLSQQSNTKLRDIAERVVAETTTQRAFPDEVAGCPVDELLLTLRDSSA
ncbi:PAS and ANTAR domain-containing protein [Mycobacterium lacus]|uniref:PAS and ANTAR domain-containing protein n=1 Tax=Mycobacterium lacus TaxID=169765 RepID=UPI001E5E3C28|nr:PAS and ANTAR domain-containing protein [Mycobacterium lacus]